MKVVVVGGGVAGLASALQLGRAGHEVTVVERDDTPMPATADEAFEWDRRGAPQVRHSHAFLARLRNLLRDHQPDILDALLAEGATEMRFGDGVPPTMDFTPEPGDDDLVMIACRRTTFEWVLRRAALAQPGVTILTGHPATALLTSTNPKNAPDRAPGAHSNAHFGVSGVRLDDGREIEADLVVAANGRRSAVAEWLEALGAPPVAEEVEDTGIVYASRFYRLLPDADLPPRTGAIGGDLGYVKYGTFVGDNRTFSVTLAVPSDDDELRRRLSDPMAFDEAARTLPATAPWLDGRAEPITSSVHLMAGLLNKWSDYVVDGEPVVTGLIPIGDAVLCTNPLYGRGCSTAYWSAHLLTIALADHADDLHAAAVAYDDALRAEIHPWYRASVEQDREGRRVSAAILAGDDPYADASDPRAFTRSVLRDGLAPALRSDQVVLRAFVRNLNLLSPPDALLTDADFGARVFAVLQTKDQRPPEPSLGPATRAEFLASLPAA
ncbi:MAG TPA: FAD-dependent oxidoreductase [Ilumatobacteraceae bacterium]|nr:FAD-dependent oxidoreductase [Ilumatobacteraceae bacterium]